MTSGGEDQSRAKTAAGSEVSQWLEESSCRLLRDEDQAGSPANEVMGSRCILTRAYDKGGEDGRTPKARLVVLGVQYPMAGDEDDASPSLGARSRMLFYQARRRPVLATS